MSKIDQLINQLCPDGVEYRTLGSLEDAGLITLGRGKVISKQDIQNNPGDYPIYSSSATNNGLLGSYGAYMFDEELITWSIDGGGKFFYRPASRYSVTNVCGWLRVNDDQINAKYLYHTLLNEWHKKVFDYVHKAHPSTIRKEYAIPMPPLEVQNEVVRILDSFTELTTELTAELATRKKQYEYYKEKLFDMGSKVAFVETSEITTDRFWLMPATPNYIENGIPYITSKNVRNGSIDFSDVKYISETDYKLISKNRSLRTGDLLITMIGTIGETAFVGDNTEFYGQNIYVIRIDETKCLKRYYYHYLTMEKIKNSLISRKNASSQGYIKAGSIEKLSLPLPSILEQKRVTDLLDKFENLCNDVAEGLPAEIESRKKQYKFYRNKLLAFDELKVA